MLLEKAAPYLKIIKRRTAFCLQRISENRGKRYSPITSAATAATESAACLGVIVPAKDPRSAASALQLRRCQTPSPPSSSEADPSAL